MAAFTLVAKIRRPTRVVTTQWEQQLEAVGRNVRGRQVSDCFCDPYAGAVMLNPEIDPEESAFGNPKAKYSLYVGNPPVLKPEAWVEGESAFGDVGYYVGFAGNATYPATTPWMAVRTGTSPFGANWATNFTVHWTPPTGNFIPQLEFWPRIDPTKWAEVGGIRYYFAPLGFYIDAQTATIVVCEYVYDSYAEFVADPTQVLRPTYQHPLDLGAMNLTHGWLTLNVLPVLEQWTRASDSAVVRRHDFVLRSPALLGGGFCYRTQVDRVALSLFPSGIPGMRSLTGGVGTLSIAPMYFPASGYVLSQEFSKRQADTYRPIVAEGEYVPPDASISSELVYPVSYPTPIQIPIGDSFQKYRIKSTLVSTSDRRETPILYTVKPTTTGVAEDRVQAETDISDSITVRESMSDDLTGYNATVILRNTDGRHNALIYRPLNEISLKVQGVDRAVIYTQDPSFKWWETPTKEALQIVWQGGDMWQRMKSLYIAGHPDYGNQTIKDAVTDYFTRLGFDTAKLHIADSLDIVYLPRSPDKDDPLFKPEDGSTADEFIADLREKFFSTYPTGFDGVGDFWISEPLDPHLPASISRVYYLSQAQALAAGDANPSFCGHPEVSFRHQDHKNEIWVIGFDPVTQEPIADMWLDIASQVPTAPLYEDYPYYVGERRLLVVVTRLPSKAWVTYYLNELRKIFGYVRRNITFETRYDPYIMPKDFIQFYGLGFVFQVMSTDVDIAQGKVSWPEATDTTDGAVYGCRIEAVEWPL